MKKRIYAIFYLAFYLFLHIFRRFYRSIRGGLSGYERFIKNFESENIHPLTPREREDLPRFQGCINCGLCSFYSKDLIIFGSEKFIGPEAVVLSLLKSFPEMIYTKDTLENFSDIQSTQLNCPQGVPFNEIVGFMFDMINK